MKKYSLLFSFLLMASSLVLADGFSVKIANEIKTTNVITKGTVSGDLVAIVVDVTGTTTGNLFIVSGRTKEVIYTNATVTADVCVRPRFLGQRNTGVEYGSTTNAPERFYLANDTLTITLSETAPVTNTYSLSFITKE